RVIQEYIKKPLADELLFGKLEHGGAVKVTVADGEDGEKKLAFEYFPAEPKPKAKSTDGDDDDDDEDETEGPALVEAVPRKALTPPKEKKDRPPRPGAVPSVPRRKDVE